MLMKNTIKGTAIETAAAGLFLAGCASKGGMGRSSAEAGDVHCMGINGCKGKTSCKSAKNDCKGKNSCKGKGWLKTTKSDCTTKGGTV